MSKKLDQKAIAQLATPSGYAEVRLGMKLHPTQKAVLDALFLDYQSRVVFRCSNEIGKTSRVGTAAVLFAIDMCDAMVVSTAGVFRQITEQLVPNLKRYQSLFPAWRFLDDGIKVNGIDKYVGFSTKEDGRFQGYHAEDHMNSPLLIIVDEAAQVPDAIINSAEERCNPTWLLVMGSPLDPSGMFYKMETELAKHYKHFKLTQPECTVEKGWWIPQAMIDRKIAKYGADHPLIRSNVFGEFPDSVEGALVSLRAFEECIESPPLWKGDEIHVGCDFAAGGDENVLAVRKGNKVWIEKAWQNRNTMAAVGEFISIFSRLQREIGLTPEMIDGDADGLGLPMVHALAEAGWPIGEWHGGAAPRFDENYTNAVSEAWNGLANQIERKEIILPNDEELKGQLLGRKTKRNSRGKLGLEPKDEMRKRGLDSPDRADAVAMACSPPRQMQTFSLIQNVVHGSYNFEEGSDLQEAGGERRYFS
jgi:phage terminase large subunit